MQNNETNPESAPEPEGEGAVRSSAWLERFGVTEAETREAIKSLFIWMYHHGITDLRIQRSDKQALLTIDGKAL